MGHAGRKRRLKSAPSGSFPQELFNSTWSPLGRYRSGGAVLFDGRPVLRLLPPCALLSHAQGSSGAVATMPFVWRGHTKSPTTRARPSHDLPLPLESRRRARVHLSPALTTAGRWCRGTDLDSLKPEARCHRGNEGARGLGSSGVLDQRQRQPKPGGAPQRHPEWCAQLRALQGPCLC